jgi:hypothetical protein
LSSISWLTGQAAAVPSPLLFSTSTSLYASTHQRLSFPLRVCVFCMPASLYVYFSLRLLLSTSTSLYASTYFFPSACLFCMPACLTPPLFVCLSRPSRSGSALEQGPPAMRGPQPTGCVHTRSWLLPAVRCISGLRPGEKGTPDLVAV